MAIEHEEGRLGAMAPRDAQNILAGAQDAQALLAAIIEASDDAIVSKTLDGVIRSWNAGAERVFGYTAAEAVGQSIDLIVPPELRDEERSILARLRRGDRVDHFETERVSKAGERLNISLTISPIRDREGRVIGASKVARDITDRKRAEAVLRKSQDQSERQWRLYEAILTNTPDLAYVFDLNHRFIYANEVLLKMWGRTWEEAIGKTCAELGYEPWHAERHDREIDQVVATKQPIRGEVPFAGTFGRRIYDYIFVPVLGANGEVEAIAGTTRDVTERKSAEEERESLLASERSARAEAERASRLKEEFLATLSHELRTPLNAILGWTQILQKEAPDAETLAQGLSVIDRNARMQMQLIGDLLDMSRISSGKMRLDVQNVELPVVIEAALDAVRPAADAKGIRIQKVLEPLAEPVRGDPTRLQQVVWNLVSNAVKFTPRGGRVQVVLARVNSSIELSVSDSGQGIRTEFLPHVFERFRQADSTAARVHSGLGLGLAIVKQLVELHGGSVHAASGGEGKGSTFTVRFPLALVHAAPTEGERAHPRAVSLSPLRYERPDLAGVQVLVVDDESDAREVIKRMLVECNARVLLAESANEAASILERERVDVILSDIGMPGQDGYALMRALRRGGSRVPAAALTAFARSEDRTRALQAGYQTHVAKPVEAAELLAAVGALIHRTVASRPHES